MAYGVKTNERPGTRAVARYTRVSAYKAREVLKLIRGMEVAEADEVLQFVERDAAVPIRKCLASAIANASKNDELDPDELYVSACFADEGPTLKRWRPRARGRATRILKRTCHITIVVSRLPEDALERRRRREAELAAGTGGRRRRGRDAAETRRARVLRSRRAQQQTPDETTQDQQTTAPEPEATMDQTPEDTASDTTPPDAEPTPPHTTEPTEGDPDPGEDEPTPPHTTEPTEGET